MSRRRAETMGRGMLWALATLPLAVLLLVPAADGRPHQAPRAANKDKLGERLAGRELNVRWGKGVHLKRVTAEGATGAVGVRMDGPSAKKPGVEQYLVRVSSPVRKGLAEVLEEVAAGRLLKYLPHDTFVMTLPPTGLDKVRRAAGVLDVFELPASMKIEPGLLEQAHARAAPSTINDPLLRVLGVKSARPKSTRVASPDLKLFVMLAHGGRGWAAQAEALVKAWTEELALIGLGADIELAEGGRKAVVTPRSASMLKPIIMWLARQPLVHWVEEDKEVSLRNQQATMAIQSWDASTHTIWDQGITGDGQVVGVADTGIDYDNCFFRDPARAPAMCSGDGGSACIDDQHRKIVSYRKFSGSDYADYSGGHGTHVCGSVAGSAAVTDAAQLEFASQYNGAAPGAKLAFDDVGDASGSLSSIPYDLATGLFPHSYATGARIHSDSWGSTATYYDTMAMEIDEFTHENDDFLVLVAAGNDGPMSWSVGAPATAKNILAVGATENAGGGSQAVAMRVDFSASGYEAEVHEITPASFGGSLQLDAPVTAQMVVASPLDGCSALDSASSGPSVVGKIALIQRGSCNFDLKVLNAQIAGAVAVVVFNNREEGGGSVIMGPADNAAAVTIPSVFISKTVGDSLHAAADSTSSSDCGATVCEARALELGLPFSTQSHSNGAPAGCIKYNDGRVIYVETCSNHANCGTSNCNGCTVICVTASGLGGNGDHDGTMTVELPVIDSAGADSLSHHTLADFSSRGPTLDLRIKPDLVCPGVNIHSAHSDGDVTSNNCGATIGIADGAVGVMSGTSMACPLCAGAAALVREYFVKGYSVSGAEDASNKALPSAALVKAVLIHSAQPVKTNSMEYEPNYPNDRTGYGRVDLSTALRFANSPFQAIYQDRRSVANAEHVEICLHVVASLDSFRISVVWTDPPGDPMSSRPLVNDLDLIVTGPGGEVFRGNNLTQTDETHGTYSVRDSINNAEQVRFSTTVAGHYAVRIIGVDVPSGPQQFALVVSADVGLTLDPWSACSASAGCPNECSGRGECLSSGTCACPITHGGPDCARAYKVLENVSDASQRTLLSVTWKGMSYYTFEVPTGGSFVLSLSPSSSGLFDADFYIAKGRLASPDDFDGAIADEDSGGIFRSRGDAQGTWVLSVHAWEGDANVNSALVFGSDGTGDPGGVDGGTDGGQGGGGGGGGDSSGNCTSSCNCGFFRSETGTLGHSDYENNANCWWVIAPSNAINVSIVFDQFNTESGYDHVHIFECDSPWCDTGVRLLEELTGSVPTGTRITSQTGYMLVTFTSDSSIISAGFTAEWLANAAFENTLPPGSGWMDGFCIDADNRDVNDGVVLLGHLSGGDDVQRTQCLGLCFVSHLSITGCELIVNQWNAGCYAHTSTRVAQANGAANHWCWLNSASEPGSGSGGGGGSGGSGGGGDGGKEESCTAPCECTLFSNSTGSFTDGSGTEMYSRFSSCRWIIAGGLGAHDGSKCSDHHHDCCAHADWSEPKTCSDGYVAIPKLPAEAPWCVCPDYDGGSACYGCYPPQGGTHDPNPEVPGNYAEYYDLSDTCRHCARDAFVYSPGLAITRGCHNCGCGDGSRMCGCAWCPEIIPESDFFPPGVLPEGGSGGRRSITRRDDSGGSGVVALSFPVFMTESSYDFVTINECQSLRWSEASELPDCVSPTLIARLSGTVSPSMSFYALSGLMEVVFTSDGSISEQGFEAEWSVIPQGGDRPPRVCTSPCECGDLTNPAGSFTDGSLSEHYPNNADCTWTIVLPDAEWIRLRFLKFETESDYDFVTLYQCEDASGDCQLAHLSGQRADLENTWFESRTGMLRVHLTSDSSVTRDGFHAIWHSSLVNYTEPSPPPPPPPIVQPPTGCSQTTALMRELSVQLEASSSHSREGCTASDALLCRQCIEEGTHQIDGQWPPSWCAGHARAGEWLQVELNQLVTVSEVETQGRYDGSTWGIVTGFRFEYSLDTSGDAFYAAEVDGSTRIGTGSNQNNFVSYRTRLDAPVVGMRFRFQVESWRNYPSMRVELWGCAGNTLPPLPPSPPPPIGMCDSSACREYAPDRPDTDCCAVPSEAYCAPGYSYVEGEYGCGQGHVHGAVTTCCILDHARLPSCPVGTVSFDSACTSLGGDCCARPWVEATCKPGFEAVRTGEPCFGFDEEYEKYECCGQPHGGWPHPAPDRWQACHLPADWRLLSEMAIAGNLTTGGLGLKIIPGKFDTWVCHYRHECSQKLTPNARVPFDQPVPRCGPLFEDAVCGGTGVKQKPRSAKWCNERNGWCGDTAAHRDMQLSTTYDFVPTESGCQTSLCRSTDGMGGHDCIADGVHEAMTCAEGFQPVHTGLRHALWGNLYEYTCCPPRRIDETDAFCWVYDESRHYFEPFGLASEVGLL